MLSTAEKCHGVDACACHWKGANDETGVDKDVCGAVGFGCGEDDGVAVETLDQRTVRCDRAVAAELGLCDRE